MRADLPPRSGARLRDDPRTAAVALAALWPAGAVLAMAHLELAFVTTPVFLVLDAVYVLAAVLLLRRFRATERGAVGVLAALPVLLFGLAGYTGPPTGDEPELLVLNTGVLLLVALILAWALTELVYRHRSAASPGAAGALMVFALGSAGYLVNLLGRVAVYLTGSLERQAAVEGEYWDASEYLRGLGEPTDPLAHLLTWMDLVQLAYVVGTYVAAGAVARVLVDDGVLSRPAGRRIAIAGWSAASVLVGCVALAIALPAAVDAVPAGIAFGLSIPFMTTLLPFAVAVSAMVRAAARRSREPHPPIASVG